MIEKYRERTTRALIAALLGSNLSTQELRRLSNELKSGSYAFELGRLLSNSLDALEDEYVRQTEPYQYSKPPSSRGRMAEENEAFRLVKNRKLTKEQTLQVIKQIAGPIDLSTSARLTLKDIIREFFQRASTDQRAMFISMIERDVPFDPYLKGLANR